MLTCITCSKQRVEDEEDAPRGTPNTNDAVKCLTTQIKDMALKVSKCKTGQAGGSFKVGQKSYPEFDTLSEGIPHPYLQQGPSNSTPSWDSRLISSNGETIPDRQEDEDEPKEWIAQVEPGVQITLVSLPHTGKNDLKRIRFSREMFDKMQAQRWWSENFDRIMELYNVHKFNQQALNTPGRSEDGRDSSYSRIRESPGMTPSVNREWTPRYGQDYYNGGARMTTSSRDEASVSISNASEVESEWIEEDEPGVYITIRQLVDGTRELRRVRFSRERFGEVHAKQWWESNKDRIQAQYLC